MGKMLIIVGIICIVVGLLITYGHRFPLFGRLPGDIFIEKENYKIYVPITTSIIISLLLSLILYLFNRYR